MKKLIISLIVVMLFSLNSFANVDIEKKVLNTTESTEFIIIQNEMGLDTCYARKCTTYTGSEGYEYKRCTDWEEVDCRYIVLAE
ncbi:MAG: hypothetical protein Q8S44_03070 [Flavobacteriaceae bacterium]|nr:hypothetical protein [Flavobacteriaceae bacterium]